jgi:DNA polymerase-4
MEPLSLDEAFLDLSDAHSTPLAKRLAEAAGDKEHELSPAVCAAKSIREDIRRETDLTGSAGVSYCKFLAKTASDIQKPDGLTVIRFCEARDFLDTLPVERFFGVGKATALRLHSMGIQTGRDLAGIEKNILLREFGKQGAFLYDLAQGRDPRAVVSDHERKSYGRETTFSYDREDLEYLCAVLDGFAAELTAALTKEGLRASTITVKVRYGDFTSETRSESFSRASCEEQVFRDKARELLGRTGAERQALRLLGLSLSGLVRDEDIVQEELPFA